MEFMEQEKKYACKERGAKGRRFGPENSLQAKKEIWSLTEKLWQLLFPGEDREATTEAAQALTQKIAWAMGEEEGEAEDLTAAFLEKILRVREMAQTDLQAAYDGDPAAVDHDEIRLAYPGFFAVEVYRFAHELHLLGVPRLPRMMTEFAHSVTGIDIHPGATIGSHFFIDHGTGVVIGETAAIGNHVKLYQGVTLGGLSPQNGQELRGQKRHPTIEDGVTIYANATILGGETVIGRGSTVGANAFICKSVESNTAVTVKDREHRFKLQKNK